MHATHEASAAVSSLLVALGTVGLIGCASDAQDVDETESLASASEIGILAGRTCSGTWSSIDEPDALLGERTEIELADIEARQLVRRRQVPFLYSSFGSPDTAFLVRDENGRPALALDWNNGSQSTSCRARTVCPISDEGVVTCTHIDVPNLRWTGRRYACDGVSSYPVSLSGHASASCASLSGESLGTEARAIVVWGGTGQ